MLLVVTAFVLLATVPLAGGRLSRLADIRPESIWAVLLAAAIQVAITQMRGGSHGMHVALHVFSYVLDAYFVFANRRLTGVPVVALGAALNVAAITANGGVMLASATALRLSGIAERAGFDNSAALAHPHLAFLGDIIPVPGPWPIGKRTQHRRPDHLRGRLHRVARGVRLPGGRTAPAPAERQNLARCARFDCRNLTSRSKRRRSWPAWPRSWSCRSRSCRCHPPARIPPPAGA
jgi:hypothetical protein